MPAEEVSVLVAATLADSWWAARVFSDVSLVSESGAYCFMAASHAATAGLAVSVENASWLVGRMPSACEPRALRLGARSGSMRNANV